MTTTQHTKASAEVWACREDDMQQRLGSHIHFNDDGTSINSVNNKRFALLGMCSDEGVTRNLGRAGASFGPNQLRAALANLPYHKTIDLLDSGNIHCINNDLDRCQLEVAKQVQKHLNSGYRSVILGGGHEIAWAHFQGIFPSIKKKKLAIVNFDAHIDMRPLKNGQGSSGTPFLQIANHCQQNDTAFNYSVIGTQSISNTPSLYDTAKEHGATLFSATQCIEQPQLLHDYITQLIDKNDAIYMTVCLDVFNGAFAPGVSAVNPAGLAPWHLQQLIKLLAHSEKLIAIDVAELNPSVDQQQQTAKLAAQVLSEVFYAQ